MLGLFKKKSSFKVSEYVNYVKPQHKKITIKYNDSIDRKPVLVDGYYIEDGFLILCSVDNSKLYINLDIIRAFTVYIVNDEEDVKNDN